MWRAHARGDAPGSGAEDAPSAPQAAGANKATAPAAHKQREPERRGSRPATLSGGRIHVRMLALGAVQPPFT